MDQKTLTKWETYERVSLYLAVGGLITFSTLSLMGLIISIVAMIRTRMVCGTLGLKANLLSIAIVIAVSYAMQR